MFYLAEYYTHRFGVFQAIAADHDQAISILIEGLRMHAAEWDLHDWIDFNNIAVKAFPANAVLRDSVETLHIGKGDSHA